MAKKSKGTHATSERANQLILAAVKARPGITYADLTEATGISGARTVVKRLCGAWKLVVVNNNGYGGYGGTGRAHIFIADDYFSGNLTPEQLWGYADKEYLKSVISKHGKYLIDTIRSQPGRSYAELLVDTGLRRKPLETLLHLLLTRGIILNNDGLYFPKPEANTE